MPEEPARCHETRQDSTGGRQFADNDEQPPCNAQSWQFAEVVSRGQRELLHGV